MVPRREPTYGAGMRATAHRLLRAALLAAALTLLLAPSAPAGPGTGRALHAALDEVMSAPGAPPGLSVLIQRGDRSSFLSRGSANLRSGAPFRPGQHYRIASMSKAFNGAIALKLVARGELALDDTVGEWLPGVLPLAEEVTVREALQHTAGLPDYIHDEQFIEQLIADPGQYMAPLQLLSFVEDTPLEFEPGSEYGYSDTDNVVVGLIAERAAGSSYDRLLRRYTTRPLRLRGTSLPSVLAMPRPFVRGYEVGPGGPPENVTEGINPALAWASGGMVSTAEDVSRFFRAYVGGELFPPRVARSQDDYVIGSSSPPGPGRNRATLGLFRYRTHCGTVFGHTGSFPGYRLFAAASRNGRRSVVFTVNAQIVPGQGSQEVSDLIRHAQVDAVCRALS